MKSKPDAAALRPVLPPPPAGDDAFISEEVAKTLAKIARTDVPVAEILDILSGPSATLTATSRDMRRKLSSALYAILADDETVSMARHLKTMLYRITVELQTRNPIDMDTKDLLAMGNAINRWLVPVQRQAEMPRASTSARGDKNLTVNTQTAHFIVAEAHRERRRLADDARPMKGKTGPEEKRSREERILGGLRPGGYIPIPDSVEDQPLAPMVKRPRSQKNREDETPPDAIDVDALPVDDQTHGPVLVRPDAPTEHPNPF